MSHPLAISVSQHGAIFLLMSHMHPSYFDLQTVALLRDALEDAWASLRPQEREQMSRSLPAERILRAAAEGERKRERLIEAALAANIAA